MDDKKTCAKCGLQTESKNVTCPFCGSEEFNAPTSNSTNPLEEFDDEENVLTGIIGAVLFSLIGGVVYFLLYKIGIIAGIAGFATFALANYGYGLFGKCRKKNSKIGVIVSAILTFVVIFITNNYVCLASDIMGAFNITFAESFDRIPEFMADSEVSSAVYENLAFGLLFAFIAIISDFVKAFKKKK